MIYAEIQGAKEFNRRLKTLPKTTRRAATMAINTTARRARAASSKEIRKQVSLTKPYTDERLTVTKYSSEADLEAVVSGRSRGTSLYRFGAKRLSGRRGVSVKVKRVSGRKKIAKGFLLKLRGNRDGFNQGVAIRLKPGESIIGKKKQFSKSDSGLYLLYAPSVDQVFATVREDISEKTSEFLTREFDRQFARLSK